MLLEGSQSEVVGFPVSSTAHLDMIPQDPFSHQSPSQSLRRSIAGKPATLTWKNLIDQFLQEAKSVKDS